MNCGWCLALALPAFARHAVVFVVLNIAVMHVLPSLHDGKWSDQLLLAVHDKVRCPHGH